MARKIPTDAALGRRPVPRSSGLPDTGRAAAGYLQAADTYSRSARQSGQVLEQTGDVIGKIAQDMQNRDDSLGHSQAVLDYHRYLGDTYRKYDAQKDFSNNDDRKAFFDDIKKKEDDLVASAPISNDARVRLTARLREMRARYSDQAGIRAAAIGIEKAKTAWGVRHSMLEGDVATSPIDPKDPEGDINRAFKGIDAIAYDMRGSFDPETEIANVRGSQNSIARAGIEKRLQLLMPEAAQALLQRPDVIDVIPEGERNNYRMRITKQIHEIDKIKTAGLRERQKVEQFLRRPLTDAEAQRHQNIHPRGEKLSFAEEVAGIEQTIKRPLTEAEILRLKNIEEKREGRFGKKYLNILTEMTPAFASGVTTGEEDREYVTAVYEYMQPRMMPNDQGLLVPVTPTLPDYAADAMRARGFQIPYYDRRPQMAGQPTMGQPPPDAPSPDGTAKKEKGDILEPSGESLFARVMGGTVTAPWARAKAFGAKTPIVGDIMGQTEETRDQQYAKRVKGEVIRVLQNSKHYAVKEREFLDKDIELNPAFFDTKTAYIDRLIAVDEILEERFQGALRTVNNRLKVGSEDHRRALTIINDISNIRGVLGVPYKIKNAAELKKMVDGGSLRSGDWVILPNGKAEQIK